jgi:hypothetical protein
MTPKVVFLENFTKKYGMSSSRVQVQKVINKLFYWQWVGLSSKALFSRNFQTTKQPLVQYLNTSTTKFLNLSTYSQYLMLFLRRSKIFNKGRYSRNRQFYRTGVYWCLYLSLILFSGLYYWFYHFIVNFGFFW